jgi:hypothetical protein
MKAAKKNKERISRGFMPVATNANRVFSAESLQQTQTEFLIWAHPRLSAASLSSLATASKHFPRELWKNLWTTPHKTYELLE